MRDIYLALPVFIPLISGIVLLMCRGQVIGQKRVRQMEWAVEGIVLFTSVSVMLLLWSMAKTRGAEVEVTVAAGAGMASAGTAGEMKLVLFRLFGNLTVMFNLDLMGGLFAGLVAFLWPLATLYSFEYMEHETRKPTFFAYYTMTYGVTMGIALAGNLVTLYVFYEMLTLVTFPLVLYPMTKEAAQASRRYLYYSIGGAAFAFLGLIFVLNFSATGTTEFLPGGILDPAAAQGNQFVLLLIYVLAFFGFGVKAALFPCHGWLPKATVAPTPVTALLHAVAVVKSGAFAILRLTYFCFGIRILRGSWAQWAVMAAALITIIYGSTMAVREVHWKRRLAYSTISNLSYILFGATMMSPLGLAASLCHLVAHAFMKICSFFCAGAVMHKSGKTYVYELDGLGKRMPLTFGCLTVASLSLMGIPLFAGFISKWNLAQAALACGGERGEWLPAAGVAVILYSALMTGIYMLTVLVRAYFPKILNAAGRSAGTDDLTKGDWAEVCDPGWCMLLPLFIFAAAILVIGLHSEPLVNLLMAIGGEIG